MAGPPGQPEPAVRRVLHAAAVRSGQREVLAAAVRTPALARGRPLASLKPLCRTRGCTTSSADPTPEVREHGQNATPIECHGLQLILLNQESLISAGPDWKVANLQGCQDSYIATTCAAA